MTEANPGLVYCSLPGFASDDPRAGDAGLGGGGGRGGGYFPACGCFAQAGIHGDTDCFDVCGVSRGQRVLCWR